jgi:carbonic anhydrase
MRNKEILKLVAGFRRFREKYFSGEDALYHRLVTVGQNPKTLIIGCSDSRVDPAMISGAAPGDIFVVRNVANIVPPNETGLKGRHGVSSAIEFAVINLKVENVVVLGHRQCGGIRALMSGPQKKDTSFIGAWMKVIDGAREAVLAKHANLDFEAQCRECEMEGIKVSLQNLMTFPFVAEAVQTRGMRLIGIYFDLEQGHLFELDETTNEFRQLDVDRENTNPRYVLPDK